MRTKILATIGPMTRSKRMILGLIAAGMRMARLNMSHGAYEDHSLTVALLREAGEESGVHLPILLDLQGPKIRVGRMQEGGVQLIRGAKVELVPEDFIGVPGRIPVLHPALLEDTAPGHPILLDDGAMRLEVLTVNEDSVTCKVVYPGILKDRKGVNLPGVDVSVPSLSEKDLSDLDWGIEKGVDYVALSFVRKAADVIELKELMASKGVAIPVIAKIEKPQAITALDGILEAADAVMVARGDLGVEFPPEKVPMLQKDIIRRANLAHKPVITATQMLESMIESPRPTRAEASDVANAILDGSDAVMLSGETAVGKYPVEAVQHMQRISAEAENALLIAADRRRRLSDIGVAGKVESTLAIGHSACSAADDIGAKAISCYTHSGAAALLMSKFRPLAPVVAVCSTAAIARRAQLYWGVTPVVSKSDEAPDMLIWDLEQAAVDAGMATSGDQIIMTAGVPAQGVGKTNFMKIHTVA